MKADDFSQFDVVRVLRLPQVAPPADEAFDLRAPMVGDIATIVEIYANPPGFELECSDENGITQWLAAFHVGEIVLELVE